MIRHIVFFSAADPDDKGRIAQALRMLGEIPHSLHFEVGENLNADAMSDRVDVVVYAEFADGAALAAYKSHPIYQDCIKIVRPLRELRLVADIPAGT